MKKDKCLFPGSFDPLTNGHHQVIKQALQDYREVHVIVMINDKKRPLFNLDRRLDIIKSLNYKNVVVKFWDQKAVAYCQKNNIYTIVRGYRNQNDLAYEKDLAKIYKNCWNQLDVKLYQTKSNASSTQVRKLIIEKQDISHLVPWKE